MYRSLTKRTGRASDHLLSIWATSDCRWGQSKRWREREVRWRLPVHRGAAADSRRRAQDPFRRTNDRPGSSAARDTKMKTTSADFAKGFACPANMSWSSTSIRLADLKVSVALTWQSWQKTYSGNCSHLNKIIPLSWNETPAIGKTSKGTGITTSRVGPEAKFKNGPNPASFLFIFVFFTMQGQIWL